jgi:hypothetical protein
MAALAALTLIIGVYPNPLLNPITGYIQQIFAKTPSVLPLPTAGHGGDSGGMQVNKNIVPTAHEFGNNIHNYNIGFIKVSNTSKGAVLK